MEVPIRILVVDDEPDIRTVLRLQLTARGYSVEEAANGREALERVQKGGGFDLIILDIMMPEMNGVDACAALREISSAPVLFLTAKDQDADKQEAFHSGGDDYLSKPYSMKELLAHVNALIRRTYGFSQQEQVVTFGNITVNLTARSVVKDRKSVSLSLREFDLLAYLCRHPNTAVSKDTLLSEVWGAFSAVEPSTLAVHIRWLREKLEDNPAEPQFIKTIYRVGYLLNA